MSDQADLFWLRRPGHGRDFNWSFHEDDLNDSARRLLSFLDQLFAASAEAGWVFLTTIENDADDAERFPGLLNAFLEHQSAALGSRYFVSGDADALDGAVGRLSFECSPKQLAKILAYKTGFRWGANLLIGGVQVREEAVSESLLLNPFDSSDVSRLTSNARLAWAASRDLDDLGVNVYRAGAALVQAIARLNER